MYTPPAFRNEDLADIHETIQRSRLATFITTTSDGLIGTPLPLMIDPAEGAYGTLYGHIAKANPQWHRKPKGDALAVFMGPDAYVTPSWYPSKREHGKVVPTWNYVAVHAYGPAEFFDDADRLLEVVTRLTERHEANRTEPWEVADAPAPFIAGQLKGIIGLRMPITRLDGKRKLSQNRSPADRAGVTAGLDSSSDLTDQVLGSLI